jgi:SLT domain-containing protein
MIGASLYGDWLNVCFNLKQPIQKESKTDEQYFNEVLNDIEGMSEKGLINYIAELYQQIDDLKKKE